MIVVSDTSCISNLISVNHLDLLHKIYNEIYIPSSVYNEILQVKADRLLIDERKGTFPANELGLTTIGLLGILKIAKENNLVSSVKNIVDKLIENNFWLSSSLYQQFLKSANEL